MSVDIGLCTDSGRLHLKVVEPEQQENVAEKTKVILKEDTRGPGMQRSVPSCGSGSEDASQKYQQPVHLL